MIRVMEDVVGQEQQIANDKFSEILNHINEIIMLMQECPGCDDVILRIYECKDRIRRLKRK